MRTCVFSDTDNMQCHYSRKQVLKHSTKRWKHHAQHNTLTARTMRCDNRQLCHDNKNVVPCGVWYNNDCMSQQVAQRRLCLKFHTAVQRLCAWECMDSKHRIRMTTHMHCLCDVSADNCITTSKSFVKQTNVPYNSDASKWIMLAIPKHILHVSCERTNVFPSTDALVWNQCNHFLAECA